MATVNCNVLTISAEKELCEANQVGTQATLTPSWNQTQVDAYVGCLFEGADLNYPERTSACAQRADTTGTAPVAGETPASTSGTASGGAITFAGVGASGSIDDKVARLYTHLDNLRASSTPQEMKVHADKFIAEVEALKEGVFKTAEGEVKEAIQKKMRQLEDRMDEVIQAALSAAAIDHLKELRRMRTALSEANSVLGIAKGESGGVANVGLKYMKGNGPTMEKAQGWEADYSAFILMGEFGKRWGDFELTGNVGVGVFRSDSQTVDGVEVEKSKYMWVLDLGARAYYSVLDFDERKGSLRVYINLDTIWPLHGSDSYDEDGSGLLRHGDVHKCAYYFMLDLGFGLDVIWKHLGASAGIGFPFVINEFWTEAEQEQTDPQYGMPYFEAMLKYRF